MRIISSIPEEAVGLYQHWFRTGEKKRRGKERPCNWERRAFNLETRVAQRDVEGEPKECCVLQELVSAGDSTRHVEFAFIVEREHVGGSKSGKRLALRPTERLLLVMETKQPPPFAWKCRRQQRHALGRRFDVCLLQNPPINTNAVYFPSVAPIRFYFRLCSYQMKRVSLLQKIKKWSLTRLKSVLKEPSIFHRHGFS